MVVVVAAAVVILLAVGSFCVISGMETEGIYRLSGQHSKVTQLLKLIMEGTIDFNEHLNFWHIFCTFGICSIAINFNKIQCSRSDENFS